MARNIRPPHRSPHSGVKVTTWVPPSKRQADVGDLQEQEPFPAQIAPLMRRLRHTIPFPVKKEDMYFGLVPPAVKDWHKRGLLSEEPCIPSKVGNFLRTVSYSFGDKSATGPFNPLTRGIHNILHVSMEKDEEYLEAERGSRGHERVFWFRTPANVPTPRRNTDPFWMPPDHPKASTVIEWYEQAVELENYIGHIMTTMALLERQQVSKNDLQHVWPQIVSFIKWRNEVRPASQINQRSIRERLRHVDREKITDLLATAIMLPDPKNQLAAWTGFFVADSGKEESDGP